jgi:hypothetical protein
VILFTEASACHEKPAKEPEVPCRQCGQSTKRRIFEGATILKCMACRRAGTEASPASDWVSLDDSQWKAKLARAIERDRRWTEMINSDDEDLWILWS